MGVIIPVLTNTDGGVWKEVWIPLKLLLQRRLSSWMVCIPFDKDTAPLSSLIPSIG